LQRAKFSQNLLPFKKGVFDMRILAVVFSTALLMIMFFPNGSTAVAQTTSAQAKHAKQIKANTPAPPKKCRGFHPNKACY
jgi:hypothetical protein